MNELENASNHPIDNARAAWRLILKRALQQSTWRNPDHNQMHSSEAVKFPSTFFSARNILGALCVAVLLFIALPIVLIIRAESHRPHYYRQGKSVVARGESLLGMNH